MAEPAPAHREVTLEDTCSASASPLNTTLQYSAISIPDSCPEPASSTQSPVPGPEAQTEIAPPRDIEGNPDGGSADLAAGEKPSWFTPKRLLAIFCIINLLNYLDRGAIASNGVNGRGKTCTESGVCTPATGIQGTFNLSNFEDGFLSSAFMVGLLVASPTFASLAKSYNPFRLIGVGLLFWTIATAGCGFSFNFWFIAICRMLVGVGEASFVSLAAPFIDDNAPVSQKTAWLAVFYMCIPSGVALGYVYGGLVGSHLNWRAAFWAESLMMLPFAILGFIMKPLQLKGFTSSVPVVANGHHGVIDKEHPDKSTNQLPSTDSSERSSQESCLSRGVKNFVIQLIQFCKDVKELVLEKIYVVNVIGFIAYNFVIGAYSYWGPKAGAAIYHMNNADIMFGGITIVCGVFGTLGGGFVLDRMESTIPNAFKLLSGASLLGGIFCFGAFCFKHLYGFIPFFCMGELLLFATQAPVNFIALHCVKPSLRPLSIALCTVSIHIFGDVPSSPLVGVLQDHINDWRKTALILTSIFSVAVIVWSTGIFLRGVDRFHEESNDNINAHQGSNNRSLLDEEGDRKSQ